MSGQPGTFASPLGLVAALYLILLPVAQLVVVPLGGAMATGADLALGGLVAAGLVAEAVPRLGRARSWGRGARGGADRAFLLLAAFGLWAALSGSWGYYPRYAVYKGAGYVMLAAGAWLLARSGGGWGRLCRAWLIGCAVALLLLLVGLLVGPEALRGRVLFDAGAVRGLPLPRTRGPFLHPSLLGCYLAVSATLLWGIWPELSRRARSVATFGAGGGALALALTASTGWVAAAVAAILIGRDRSLLPRPRLALLLWVGGTALAALVLVGVLVPLSFELGPWTVLVGAVRPAIWSNAAEAVVTPPLIGVGAAPFLAVAPDPAGGAALHLWDAHQAYLSVVGQFGLVGAALAGAGAALLVRGMLAAPQTRARTAALAALAAVATHGFLVANEDARHVWALLGVAAALLEPHKEPTG